MNLLKSTKVTIKRIFWRPPILFLGIMLAVLTIIITIWLVACGILLQLPLVLNQPIDSLGFIFGYVWGFFASSWALLVIMQPNLTYFDSFTRVLTLHLEGAPGLYSLHCLCLVALICWCFFLFNGLLAFTYGRAITIIKISAILCALFLIIFLTYFLFSDRILT